MIVVECWDKTYTYPDGASFRVDHGGKDSYRNDLIVVDAEGDMIAIHPNWQAVRRADTAVIVEGARDAYISAQTDAILKEAT